MEIKGFDDFSKKLDQLANNARDIGNTSSVPLIDILTPEFVSQHTRFANASDLFNAGNFDVSNQTTFEAISEGKLDEFVRSASSFSSWREMLNSAATEWTKRKLGF